MFDTNAFWPLPRTLAFSDALLGYAPFGAVGDGPGAALTARKPLRQYSVPFTKWMTWPDGQRPLSPSE